MLIEWGFVLNPCDQCVANKMINSRQCTIVWHMDNLEISHVEKGVVEDVISLENNSTCENLRQSARIPQNKKIREIGTR